MALPRGRQLAVKVLSWWIRLEATFLFQPLSRNLPDKSNVTRTLSAQHLQYQGPPVASYPPWPPQAPQRLGQLTVLLGNRREPPSQRHKSGALLAWRVL